MGRHYVKRKAGHSEGKLCMNQELFELANYLLKTRGSAGILQRMIDTPVGFPGEAQFVELCELNQEGTRFYRVKSKVKSLPVEESWLQRHKECADGRVNLFDCLVGSRVWTTVSAEITNSSIEGEGEHYLIKTLPTLRAFSKSYVLRLHYSDELKGLLEINCANTLPVLVKNGVSGNAGNGGRILPTGPVKELETKYEYSL